LTNILGKSKDEIMYIIANSCVPCTQGESWLLWHYNQKASNAIPVSWQWY
jgi:hypothetical protein